MHLMSPRRLALLAVVLLALATLTTPALAVSGYSVVDLNPPDATSSQATSINDKGEVVGYYFDSSNLSHAAILYPTFRDLANSSAWTINNQGFIAGNICLDGVCYLSDLIVWSPAGKMADLGVDTGVSADVFPTQINSNRQMSVTGGDGA